MNPKDTKPVVEERSAISVFELTNSKAFQERRYHGRSQHRAFDIGDTDIRVLYSELAHDWYLELANPGPRCGNTTISLVQTPCNYGGYRYWLECPKCLKRAGILYRDEDNFRCRPCLGLGYWSQKMNYRTLLPTLRRWTKLQEMNPARCRSYKGKPTRYTQRYEKLRSRVSIGIDIYSPLDTNKHRGTAEGFDDKM